MQRRGEGPFNGAISFTNDEANNPFDTSFPFANAAIGTFQSYSQQSRWAEGAYLAINHEAFIQDNWKVKPNLTLDYGLRFVHQVPQYDAYLQAANFFPEEWSRASAPVLYVAGCANGARPARARPAGDEPEYRTVPGPEQHAGDWHARARHRRSSERHPDSR
jgi:hypothetical protein